MISKGFKWAGKTPYRCSVDGSNGGESGSHPCLVRMSQSGQRHYCQYCKLKAGEVDF